MLTMEQYNALSESEKADAIIQADFLTDREENGLVVQLYSLGKITGGGYYDRLANKVLRYRVFEGTQQLTRHH